ncbi:MAG: NAD(P)-binding protein [Firmicutes bacterium]|nr:NAD(P)-binding protein [Bacillota bacterium]
MDQKQLRELEAKCIQEEPPECTAACPVHVDVKGFIKALRDDNLSTAFNILAKATVFPRIIGHICHHPCENHCKRREVEAPISIHELERYCVKNAVSKKRSLRIKRSTTKVAVVGAGLCGLSAAVELTRKGYLVTLIEARAKLGGRLLSLPADILPRAILQEELEIISTLDIDVLYNRRIGSLQEIKEIKNDYAAVFIACNGVAAEAPSTQNPTTLATSLEGVFARDPRIAAGSFIDFVAQGKKAALSMERYIQKVSQEAGREREGPFATRLYTNTAGLEPIPAVKPQDKQGGYTREEARKEAERCLLCECLECVKACEYLRAFGSYPKRYLREIYNNEAIVMGPRLANNLINSCSLCGLCKEVCPNGLDMGAVIKKAREGMVLRGKMPPSPHDFPLADMNFSNGPHFSLLKNAPGTENSRYLYFPGCQLCATMPPYVELSYDYLRRTFADVGLFLGCCGAPADWVGQRELFDQARGKILQGLRSFGNPTLILACSTCYDIFQAHYPELDIISLYEVYDQYGFPSDNLLQLKGEIAIHDACTARHANFQQQAIRGILKKLRLPYHELAFSKNKTTCCGFGGLMTFANQDVATAAIDRRIKESQHPYLVYCAMCKDRFSWRSKETYHVLDLIYGGIYQEDREKLNTTKNLGFSQKRENRARLKEKMLRDLWGEDMTISGLSYPYELEITAEAREKMEERLILKEDILKVIHHAETSGNKLLREDSGHFLAYYQPVSVTYWVEYTQKDNTFKIHNVYSHRMEIGEG